jgi:hypothetical protein
MFGQIRPFRAPWLSRNAPGKEVATCGKEVSTNGKDRIGVLTYSRSRPLVRRKLCTRIVSEYRLVKFARSVHFGCRIKCLKKRFLRVEKRFSTSGKDLIGVTAIVDPLICRKLCTRIISEHHLIKFARSLYFGCQEKCLEKMFLRVEKRFSISGKDLIGVIAIVDPLIHRKLFTRIISENGLAKFVRSLSFIALWLG